MQKYNCIVILGPTGSGKTKLSLSLAKILNGEIVNADSMQIYKYLNIGTAKATESEQAIVKHHMLDIIDPKDNFSVSEFRDKTLQICGDLIKNNKMPIIVGGTGFYIESLLKNYSYGDIKDEDYRLHLNNIVNEKGCSFLFNMLKEIDPESANKLHENDIKRVIRALEIFKVTGKTKSEIENLDSNKTKDCFLKPYIIGLTCDREILYNRINARVDIMVNDGLVDEVKWCLDYGLNSSHQSMGGIGYKELFPYFAGESTLDNAIDKIKQHTRNYAKRQMTWFRRMNDINWFDINKFSTEKIIEIVIKELQ